MDFKVKFFNSERLDEIETRRFKIEYSNFTFDEFLSYLKKLNDVCETETIYVFWKDTWEWHSLRSEEDWDQFIEKIKSDCKALLNVNIFYGNVHVNVPCDICGKIVIGDRYKCLQCDDFDICQLCFQAKLNCHNEHSILLLRTPKDSAKFLSSFNVQFPDGSSDYRVTDVDFRNMFINLEKKSDTEVFGKETQERDTQTEISDIEIGARMFHLEINTTKENGQSKMEMKSESSENDSAGSKFHSPTVEYDSCVTKDYIDNLPSNIIEGLNALKSMGFRNMNGMLTALLVEKNGCLMDVIEELEYSLKNK